MKTETELREALRNWVVAANGGVRPRDLDDRTPLIERKLLGSLQTLDLLLFVEGLTGRRIDASRLKPGAFRSIDAIYEAFCREAKHAR